MNSDQDKKKEERSKLVASSTDIEKNQGGTAELKQKSSALKKVSQRCMDDDTGAMHDALQEREALHNNDDDEYEENEVDDGCSDGQEEDEEFDDEDDHLSLPSSTTVPSSRHSAWTRTWLLFSSLWSTGSTDRGLSESSPPENEGTDRRRRRRTSIWFKCLVPDRTPRICGWKLLDGPYSVKLAKFIIITMMGICLIHWFVRRMGWEHREDFELRDFWTYESTMVVVDALFFFTVGRLHQQRGVDHLVWIFVALAGGFYASYITNFRFLQQSVTLYAMHCLWSWKLWLFVLILIPLIITIILLHVKYAVQHGLFFMKLLELILSAVFLLLPSATSPYLHLHHWFAGWLLGMHTNFNVWWSRCTMAWCWGLYMNGIAVYGRDPVLTCGYTLFLSTQQNCPFLDCYLEGLERNKHDHNDTILPPVQEMKTPDWRNCSADAYHP